MKVTFRCVDLETTGLAPPAEIVEVARTDVHIDVDATPRTVAIDSTDALLFRPLKGIPPETSAVHHITMRDVAGIDPCTTDDLHALVIYGEPRFVVAHNAAFERQWITDDVLPEGVRWVDTFKCAIHLWPDAPGFDLQTLRYFLELDLDAARAMPPHRAGPDTYVCAELLAVMLHTTSVRQLVEWSMQPRWYPTCPDRKHRGPWESVPMNYIAWKLRLDDVEPDLRAAFQAEADRRRGGHPTGGML